MVILRTRNKITDFLMILAWASPFKKGLLSNLLTCFKICIIIKPMVPSFLSLLPLCGGEDILFLPSPPFATCFCSHWKTPARIFFFIISSMQIGPEEFGKFLGGFFQQHSTNPKIAAKILCHSL